ncbi:hypothetical protein [Robiginitalea sp. IMCC43444]|uniref:hypothetical protein n=1 Tax=Robiginitalea sp. IMCC43444 TaxID=3459121 RepID=UPI0040419350
MSKIYLQCVLIIPFVLFSLMGHAQDRPNQQKIKALKIAFFTERLELSPEEASVFWPIYNKYEQEKERLRNMEIREVRSRIAAANSFSESEAKQILNRYIAIEEEQEELDKNFYREMAASLSASKTLQLFRAELEFRRRLLKEFRKRQGN